MNSEWTVRIDYRPELDSYYLWIMRRDDLDAVEIARWRENTWYITRYGPEEQRTSQPHKDGPSLEIPDSMARTLLPSLVEALDKRGVKMPEKSFMEGELTATKRHLADLRHLLKIP